MKDDIWDKFDFFKKKENGQLNTKSGLTLAKIEIL